MDIKSIQMFATADGTLLTVAVKERPQDIADTVMKANLGGYELKIQEKWKKRSLDANSYYHSLKDKLARALRTSEDELHEELIKRYGPLREREDGSIVTFIHPSDRDPREIQKYSRPIRYGEVEGKAYTAYAALKGSSEMSSAEFSALLDGLISECKEQGIETLTPAELQQLKGYGYGV